MEQPTNSTRKKFIIWGTAILSSVTMLKIFSGTKKPDTTAEKNNAGTVKMLTQEGKLVEVDKNLLAAGHKKISNEELQKWVSKK